jgi:hypothetical protein
MKMYAAGVLIAVVIAFQIALWAKFRNEPRGRRIGVRVLQFLLVVAWMVVVGFRPQWTLGMFGFALLGVVALSFVPARKSGV